MDRVVVRLRVVQVFVRKIHEREVNCLSTFVWVEVAWYEPFFFDGNLVLRVPDVVNVFRMA